jgi:hypothetical protein
MEESASNGHGESVCYHPLFVFTRHGDCPAATLRPGTVHSADGWDEVFLPAIDRYRAQGRGFRTIMISQIGPSRSPGSVDRDHRDRHRDHADRSIVITPSAGPR